ncbi:E3 SUMO- ligase KIAA1586-like isoform X3 [Paramuricea clavata]|uniref:E3 SUMO- ligase KIAA1586-like isoform X3 n=1 Tax=Paramuricea clavata TaxID=317549 RepID=A0A7D9LL17_PARCT|nr:E3 SUMO- ligase KIAA1586-like isoform X3 [Paramuricea clavata]
MTSNCQLPIANAHEEAERLNDCDKTWCDKSDKHPWVRVFKKWNDEKLQGLVCIAIDAYNDSQVETLSARSWPSRSLAVEHSNHVLHHFESQGWDADFVPFDPPASCYHYRDPMLYAEIRNIIAKQEMKKVAQLLKDCLCYSVQIDGSADKLQVDSKFITARYVPCDEVSVKTVFLGIASSDLGGAEGLLDSFTTCIENIGINTDKLVGVTTDGENANTEKNAGLWKLLQDYIGRDILTIWCVCHRSDLALESVQAEVPELTIWMSNVLAVATFFRTSPRRTKLLHKVVPHSMATERVVSHYNNVKTWGRSSLNPETINGILHISLNGKGASFFDPRPVVSEFLTSKERRNREPCEELYKQREFVKHFFKQESGCL